jgi:hypothetical protein
MINRQYLWFFLNGGVLGILSLWLQAFLFQYLDANSGSAYALAACLTYLPLMVINFFIQRFWIFKKNGFFWLFVVSNLSIMGFVALLSPLFRLIISIAIDPVWGDKTGFALAAIVMSIPSYFVKRILVFNRDNHVQY